MSKVWAPQIDYGAGSNYVLPLSTADDIQSLTIAPARQLHSEIAPFIGVGGANVAGGLTSHWMVTVSGEWGTVDPDAGITKATAMDTAFSGDSTAGGAFTFYTYFDNATSDYTYYTNCKLVSLSEEVFNAGYTARRDFRNSFSYQFKADVRVLTDSSTSPPATVTKTEIDLVAATAINVRNSTTGNTMLKIDIANNRLLVHGQIKRVDSI